MANTTIQLASSTAFQLSKKAPVSAQVKEPSNERGDSVAADLPIAQQDAPRSASDNRETSTHHALQARVSSYQPRGAIGFLIMKL